MKYYACSCDHFFNETEFKHVILAGRKIMGEQDKRVRVCPSCGSYNQYGEIGRDVYEIAMGIRT